jgi:hypothetical protein
MKKVILLIALVISPMISYGQSIFDKLEDTKGISSVIVNKEAFEILSKFNVNTEDNEAMQVFEMIKDLNELKIFSANNSKVVLDMSNMVKSAIKNYKLIEFIRVKEDDSQVKIYVKYGENKDYVSEVLMYVTGVEEETNGFSEAVVISLTGNIDINKLSKIADTFTKESSIEISTSKAN